MFGCLVNTDNTQDKRNEKQISKLYTWKQDKNTLLKAGMYFSQHH